MRGPRCILFCLLTDIHKAVLLQNSNETESLSDGPPCVQYIRVQYPERPVFIVGRSLGGLMAVLTVISMPDVFRQAGNC